MYGLSVCLCPVSTIVVLQRRRSCCSLSLSLPRSLSLSRSSAHVTQSRSLARRRQRTPLSPRRGGFGAGHELAVPIDCPLIWTASRIAEKHVLGPFEHSSSSYEMSRLGLAERGTGFFKAVRRAGSSPGAKRSSVKCNKGKRFLSILTRSREVVAWI